MNKPYEKATQAMLREAKRRGRAKGEGWADVQYLPGGGRDTARDAAGRAKALLEDGDSDVLHAPCWLSGEWADEPTGQDIASACGVDPDRDPDGEILDEVCNVYIEAADTAYRNVIERHLRHVAKGEPQ